MSGSEEWHKVRIKIYYAAYRRGKVGEIVECWFGNCTLREGEIIIRKPNGQITAGSEEQFFNDYEEVEQV